MSITSKTNHLIQSKDRSVTFWSQCKASLPRYFAERKFITETPELRLPHSKEESVKNRFGTDPKDFLNLLSVPTPWREEAERFIHKYGYINGFRALAIRDLFDLHTVSPNSFFSIPCNTFERMYRDQFERLKGWIVRHAEIPCVISYMDLPVFPGISANPQESMLLLSFDRVRKSVEYRCGGVTPPDAFITFSLKDQKIRICSMGYSASGRRRQKNFGPLENLEDLLVSALENYIYDRFIRGSFGSQKNPGLNASPLIIEISDSAAKIVHPDKNLKIDIESCLVRNGYRTERVGCEGVSGTGCLAKVLLPIRYDPHLTESYFNAFKLRKGNEFHEDQRLPEALEARVANAHGVFKRLFENRIGQWIDLAEKVFDFENGSVPGEIRRLASILDQSVELRAAFLSELSLGNSVQEFTSKLRRFAIPVPVQRLTFQDDFEVTFKEEEALEGLVEKYGFQIARELLSSQFTWMSLGENSLEKMDTWSDVLKKRTPGYHLLHMHLQDQNRHPAWCIVLHDQKGDPVKTVWIGHKGGGIGYVEPGDVVDVEDIQSLMYRRTRVERWGDASSQWIWGGMSLDEGRDSYRISRRLSTMFEECFNDGVQRVAMPFDAVALERIPYWRKGTSGVAGWYDWDEFVKKLFQQDPKNQDAFRPTVYRSLSRSGIRLGGLVNAVFARSEESLHNPSHCRDEVDTALRYLYFQHGKKLLLPEKGVEAREGVLGPGEIAIYLQKVAALNKDAAEEIYRSSARAMISTTGFIHGTEGDLGGSLVPGKAHGSGAGGSIAIRNVDLHGILHDISGVRLGIRCRFKLLEAETVNKQFQDRIRSQKADIMHLYHCLYWTRVLCFGMEVAPGVEMSTVQRGYHNYITFFGAPPQVLSDERLGLMNTIATSDSEAAPIYKDMIKVKSPEDIRKFAEEVLGDGWEFSEYSKACIVGSTASPVDAASMDLEAFLAKNEAAVRSIRPVEPATSTKVGA